MIYGLSDWKQMHMIYRQSIKCAHFSCLRYLIRQTNDQPQIYRFVITRMLAKQALDRVIRLAAWFDLYIDLNSYLVGNEAPSLECS